MTDPATAQLASVLRATALNQLQGLAQGIATIAHCAALNASLGPEETKAMREAQDRLEAAYAACGWLLQKVPPWDHIAQAPLEGPTLPEVQVPEDGEEAAS